MTKANWWIDGHLDLAYLVVNGRDISQPVANDADACISLPALREAGVDLALGTIFTEMNYTGAKSSEAQVYARDDFDTARQCGIAQLGVYTQLESAGELSIVRSADDLTADGAQPRIVILMEGGDPIRDAADVQWWHDHGVRVVGLTWAMGSKFAGGNATGGGLSDASSDVIAAMDELNIVHDASHLSEDAFWDLCDCSEGKIVASHSNARSIDHSFGERNLSDAQIRAIGDRKGIIGINLFTKFLATGRRATVADVVTHIEHIADIMGHRNGIGLGSDMDGGFAASKLAAGVDHPGLLPALGAALGDAGWSVTEVEGFASGNWFRFLTEVLG